MEELQAQIVMNAEVRSAPIKILSRAYSKSNCVTPLLPSVEAFSAAALIMLAKSAPEQPGVVRAKISGSHIILPWASLCTVTVVM